MDVPAGQNAAAAVVAPATGLAGTTLDPPAASVGALSAPTLSPGSSTSQNHSGGQNPSVAANAGAGSADAATSGKQTGGGSQDGADGGSGRNTGSSNAGAGSVTAPSPAGMVQSPAPLQAALAAAQPVAPTASNGDSPAPGKLPATAAMKDTAPLPAADSASLPAVNTARVLQSVGQAEMRVGMHSPEFGAISISTSLSPQGIAARISLDHLGLGSALEAHLPAIQEKLGAAYGLPSRVEIRDTGAQFGGGTASQDGTGTGQSSRGNTPYPRGGPPAVAILSAPAGAPGIAEAHSAGSPGATTARLSVRA